MATASTAGPSSSQSNAASRIPLEPPSKVTRLPVLKPSPESNDRLKDFSLDGIRHEFTVTTPLLCVRVPARESGIVAKSKEMKDAVLRLARISPVTADGQDGSSRLVRLAAQRKEDLPSDALAFLESKGYPIVESSIEVGWDYFTSDQIVAALLPGDLAEGSPNAFTVTGHILHLNLREDYLPYRHVIGKILLEKNPGTRTVVNKLEGIDNQFRFFDMELLAGEADYVAETSESDCTFRFDFRTVYWNSRLHAEHWRLISSFPAYSVLCDVMAGVGPFAVPAAKRFVWTLANDLNPSSHASLVDNAKRNRVDDEIRCFCEDGRDFIRASARRIWHEPRQGPFLDGSTPKRKNAKDRAKEEHTKRAAIKAAKQAGTEPDLSALSVSSSSDVKDLPSGPRLRPRKLVDSYVMNLPGSAIEFLDAYRGIYKALAADVGEGALKEEIEERGKEEGRQGGHRPVVHVHTFTKHLEFPHEDVIERANAALGLTGHAAALRGPASPPPDKRALSTPLSLSSARSTTSELEASQKEYIERLASIREAREEGGERGVTSGISIHLVRAVAPNKDMYCLSFPLPDEVLWDL